MRKVWTYCFIGLVAALLGGCMGKVPLAPTDQVNTAKQFNLPPQDKIGLYIYRDERFGGIVKKNLFIDKQLLGPTIYKTFYYVILNPGKHLIETESETGNNFIEINTTGGRNYFVKQEIKAGVLLGRAIVYQVLDEIQAKEAIKDLDLAQNSEIFK